MPADIQAKQDIYGFVAALKLSQIAAYDCQLHNAARRMLMLLSGFTNKDGVLWPSISKIAEKLMMTRPAIISQIRILEAHGYIKSTSRSNPENGATRTNTYSLNLDIARNFQDTPDIFCEKNYNLLLEYFIICGLYPVTSGSYPPCNSIKLPLPAISTSYTKKEIIEETNIKKPVTGKLSKKDSKTIQKANNWDRKKEFEERTGITVHAEQELASILNELRLYKNSKWLTNLDLDLNRQAKGLSPNEALQFKTSKFLEELLKLRTKNIDNKNEEKII